MVTRTEKQTINIFTRISNITNFETLSPSEDKRFIRFSAVLHGIKCGRKQLAIVKSWKIIVKVR